MKDGVIEVQVVFVWGGWDEDGNCGQKCGDFGKMQEQNTSQHDQLVVNWWFGAHWFWDSNRGSPK